jgi:hypothetical protein
MADLAALMEEAELGDLSRIWNPFAIIDGRGLDGAPVFTAMLSRILVFGISLLVLMVLLRIIQHLFRALSGGAEEDGILGIAAEAALVAALLLAYPAWIRLLPEVFNHLGRAIQAHVLSDLVGQASGALAQIGNEKASDFRMWSEQVIALPILSLLAAVLSTVALVLLWVMAKLQAYLFAFWYLLGPVALPTLLFPPLAHVGRIWFGTFLGVSFISVTGPLLHAILARSGWMAHAFASGGELDALSCLVFSLLTILLMVSIPILALKVWSGVESRVFCGASASAQAIAGGTALVQAAGSRAQSAYNSWRAERLAARPIGAGSPPGPKGEGG